MTMSTNDPTAAAPLIRLDTVSPRLIEQFRATLGDLAGPEAVPPGLHWCLANDAVTPDLLGRDGHPRPGLFLPALFLPALSLPRRMWAGGELAFHRPFAPGGHVMRKTAVEAMQFKQGRSGPLGFLTLRHDYQVGDVVYLSERQDLVYREDPKADAHESDARESIVPAPHWSITESRAIRPSSTLLFRYSALTFNGHRIHYDYPYATEVEGYAGLVVHGPLQATWMLAMATSLFGRPPRRFSYRGLSPLICDTPIAVEASQNDDGLALRIRRETDGGLTMQATAT